MRKGGRKRGYHGPARLCARAQCGTTGAVLSAVVALCSCGRTYRTLDDWRALELVGFVTEHRQPVLETRMCRCNSSLSRAVSDDEAWTKSA